MKNLKNFLHPKRRENCRFVLSDAFVDDNGQPLEWEMRQVSADEGVEIAKETESLTNTEVMAYYIAQSLVVPNLKDAELVKAMAEEHNGKIMKPHEILRALVTDGEFSKLIRIWNEHNRATVKFGDLIEEAKN